MTELVRYHDGPIAGNEKLLRRRLRQLGEEAFFQLLEVQKADTRGLAEPYRSQRCPCWKKPGSWPENPVGRRCFSMKQLAVSGKDLMAAGMKPGPELGRVLNRLLEGYRKGSLYVYLLIC